MTDPSTRRRETGKGPRLDATLTGAIARLAGSGRAPDECRIDAEVLLCHAIGCTRATLFAWPDKPVDEPALAHFQTLLAERSRGTPVAYLLKSREFWSLDLYVDARVLIPRADTERLVEAVLDLAPGADTRIIDAGTGSGAVAVALATSCAARIIATDISADALSVAAINVQRHCPGRVGLLHGDWLSAVAENSVNIVASNPPYIAAADPHLSQGDLRFEPQAALAAGIDGLDAIGRLSSDAWRVLRERGALLIEHGFDQGEAVREIFSRQGYTDIATLTDLAGLERVTLGRCPTRNTGIRS